MEALATVGPVVYLECGICGEATVGRQWWNHDDGYGICDRCAHRYQNECWTYGKRGIHYLLPDGPALMERMGIIDLIAIGL